MSCAAARCSSSPPRPNCAQGGARQGGRVSLDAHALTCEAAHLGCVPELHALRHVLQGHHASYGCPQADRLTRILPVPRRQIVHIEAWRQRTTASAHSYASRHGRSQPRRTFLLCRLALALRLLLVPTWLRLAGTATSFSDSDVRRPPARAAAGIARAPLIAYFYPRRPPDTPQYSRILS